MKRNFLLIMVCAVAYSVTSCSNDKDDPILNPNEKIITISANCPVIEPEGAPATTRIDFSENNGLVMKWQTTDYDNVRLAGYYNNSGAWAQTNSGKDRKTSSITGPTAGNPSSNATFTFTAFTETVLAYSVTVGHYRNGDTPGAMGISAWKNENIIDPQTQDGNGNTVHLNNLYLAAIDYIKADAISNLTFSSTWANTNKYVPTGEISGEPAADKCGKFFQSSCIKFDITLPGTYKLSDIKKLF